MEEKRNKNENEINVAEKHREENLNFSLPIKIEKTAIKERNETKEQGKRCDESNDGKYEIVINEKNEKNEVNEENGQKKKNQENKKKEENKKNEENEDLQPAETDKTDETDATDERKSDSPSFHCNVPVLPSLGIPIQIKAKKGVSVSLMIRI